MNKKKREETDETSIVLRITLNMYNMILMYLCCAKRLCYCRMSLVWVVFLLLLLICVCTAPRSFPLSCFVVFFLFFLPASATFNYKANEWNNKARPRNMLDFSMGVVIARSCLTTIWIACVSSLDIRLIYDSRSIYAVVAAAAAAV